MTNPIPTTYHHTQRGPWSLLVYAIEALAVIAAVILKDKQALAVPFLIAAFALGFIAACFHRLTIADEIDCLKITFGPIPLFQRSVRYDDICSVEVRRTRIFDGWGVHLSVRGGWVWNIWGRDCVLIELQRGRKLWLGTDEPNELCQFLKGKTVLAKLADFGI